MGRDNESENVYQDRSTCDPWRLGRVAEWLVRRTHNPMIAGSSLTGTSNILGQDMNPVNVLQCCPSRGWQCVAPEVDLRKYTLHLPLQCE